MPLRTHTGEQAELLKGRGAAINPEGRFENVVREAVDDGWNTPQDEEQPKLETTVTEEIAKSIIARNDSPDVGFSQSINPYRGCQHGCIYCYARPTHAYVNLSPGLDFETRLFAKVNAAKLLREELSRTGYCCEVIALGMNTDCYQPIEKDYRITRGILEVLSECVHPVGIVTKSAMVERDLDLLVPMAQKNLVSVYITITTLDHKIARRLEPRAAAPARRLQTIKKLIEAGVPCGVMVAPGIPFLTDFSVEQVLEAAHKAGAIGAGYVLLRLPYEIKNLFKDWLNNHYPLKAEHVMSRVREMRDGKEYDSQFGTRMRGTGEYADLLAKRFKMACERLGFNRKRFELDTQRFCKPQSGGQMALF